MIHLSAIHKLVLQNEGRDYEFDIACVSMSSGRLMKGRVICTSSNNGLKSINIKFINSGEIRKVKTLLIIEFNDIPVYI
jgi:hypothetical protein